MEELSAKDLKELARDHHIKYWYRLRKEELVEALLIRRRVSTRRSPAKAIYDSYNQLLSRIYYYYFPRVEMVTYAAPHVFQSVLDWETLKDTITSHQLVRLRDAYTHQRLTVTQAKKILSEPK
jgi:hypothetical protein